MGIFARVLQATLEAHQGDDYSYLGGQEARNDPIWHPLRRLAIAPEVISRLKAAATSNEKRATLNPDDFSYACEQLRFKPEERNLLRAALLAQAVEIFLRDRMEPDEDDAVSEITNLVFRRLVEHFEEPYHQVRGGDNPFLRGDELEGALALLDRANSFRQAWLLAQAAGVAQEALFWRAVTVAAHEVVIGLLESVQLLDLATELRRRLATDLS